MQKVGRTVRGALKLRCQRTTTEVGESPRVTEVSLSFGVPRSGIATGPAEPVPVRLGVGRILAFVGPSGSGKSTAIDLIEESHLLAHNVGRISFVRGRSIVDAVLRKGTLPDTLAILSACGLGEPRLWIRYYRELSEGEKFRARLAKAVGLHAGARTDAPLLCDEFCTGLHPRMAKAIAFNLRKLVTRRKLNVVVAMNDERVLADLQPDTLVRFDSNGGFAVTEAKPACKRVSMARRMHIEPGSKRDYAVLAHMHYRATDELGFVDKVFVMREGIGGPIVGIVVYSHGPLELALRNQATSKRYSKNPQRLNREMRILRRLVLHPDLRGCGLAAKLVKHTLPLVGTRFVECLAAMGAINPVFEKAGMKRVGQCKPPPEQARALGELSKLGIDPFAREFMVHVCRRPRVRRIVARFVYNWYRATTGRGERRVARQSPQVLAQTFRGLVGAHPVYYLWEGTK